MVILSIQCAMRDDGQLAPSEIVYGSSLTLPADLLVPSSGNIVHNEADYSHRFRKYMQEQRPIQRTHNVRANPYSYVESALLTCEKVLIRNKNKRGLQANYSRPFKVLQRSAKYFTVEQANGTPNNVSIDRLKACYTYQQALPRALAPEQLVTHRSGTTAGASQAMPSGDVRLDATFDSVDAPGTDRFVTTRVGRQVRPPRRYGWE